MVPATIQPAGNFYDKYRTRNPVARWLMQGFLRAFDQLLALVENESHALEIGCGEGELSMRLARSGMAVEGCDIAIEAVEEATRRAKAADLAVEFSCVSISDAVERFAPRGLVVCCEVLEHIEDTQAALAALDGLSTRYILVSVPREPIWRVLNIARLRYMGALGNTPGHIQHWSKKRFLTLLADHFDVVAVRSPLPWTMALCRVRH